MHMRNFPAETHWALDSSFPR